jgi:hypothetical protein
MTKEDIIGGIRIALSKGQKLEDAMQSFYNAGYKKEDIEQAVSELFSETSQSVPQQYPQSIQIPQIQKPVEVPKPNQLVQQAPVVLTQQIQQPRTVQQTSQQYRQPIQQQRQQISQSAQQSQQTKPGSNSFPTLEEIQKRYQSLAPPPTLSSKKQIASNYEIKKKMDVVTIMLIFILALLFGVLAAVFIFKKQIVEVLNNFL